MLAPAVPAADADAVPEVAAAATAAAAASEGADSRETAAAQAVAPAAAAPAVAAPTVDVDISATAGRVAGGGEASAAVPQGERGAEVAATEATRRRLAIALSAAVVAPAIAALLLFSFRADARETARRTLASAGERCGLVSAADTLGGMSPMADRSQDASDVSRSGSRPSAAMPTGLNCVDTPKSLSPSADANAAAPAAAADLGGSPAGSAAGDAAAAGAGASPSATAGADAPAGEGVGHADQTFVCAALSALYKRDLRRIEEQCLFAQFHQDPLEDAEICARPGVLLLGQYSTGKTSFIRRVLSKDYPNMHVGPEPSTDRFVAVVPGREARAVKGTSLTVVPDLPYQGLKKFGTSFLHKFEAAIVPDSPLLEQVSFVDTPGVLAGEKQKREYDFLRVARWFAERSDMVLLMFDGSKLDISDEFKAVIHMLRPNPEKLRVILNKADQISTDELVRVTGALMWSLGKVVNTPEVLRVYIGSFWEEQLRDVPHKSLMERDMAALMRDLHELPQQASVRRIEEMVIRVRLLRVHICLLDRLRSEMPWFWGHAAKKRYLLDNFEKVLADVCVAHDCSYGDLPSVARFKEQLEGWDFTRLPRLSGKPIATLNRVLKVDIPPIISRVHGVSASAVQELAQRATARADQSKRGARRRRVCYGLLVLVFFSVGLHYLASGASWMRVSRADAGATGAAGANVPGEASRIFDAIRVRVAAVLEEFLALVAPSAPAPAAPGSAAAEAWQQQAPIPPRAGEL
eukprot:TRINITY_DN4574_c1_g1_i1.p1 TRINITY_DN4574_c1_g1~~TRINITY_DN4574_c1_g1_i1.p1  ORF type:complete len:750 (-),score=183.02 TRINITY_DN4574_c1_g1_i1:82-2331(-)